MGRGLFHVLRRAERLREERLEDELTIDGWAAGAGVSTPTLFPAFARHRGCPPRVALRRARRARVRQEFTAPAPETTVTDVAMRWGFFHLGRRIGTRGVSEVDRRLRSGRSIR